MNVKEEIKKTLKEIENFNNTPFIKENGLCIYDTKEARLLKHDTRLYVGERATIKEIHERTGKALVLVKDYNRGSVYVEDRGMDSGVIYINYYESDEEHLQRLKDALNRQKRSLTHRKEHIIEQYNKAKQFYKF